MEGEHPDDHSGCIQGLAERLLLICDGRDPEQSCGTLSRKIRRGGDEYSYFAFGRRERQRESRGFLLRLNYRGVTLTHFQDEKTCFDGFIGFVHTLLA